MQLNDLNKKYDEMQLKYGEPSLFSIYNGGCKKSPRVCFIFMNPTGKNIASTSNWNGIRAPWIGTKNVWKLFYNVGIIDKNLNDTIQSMKSTDWTEEFAKEVYDIIDKKGIYITNLGKCTQIDARPLPNRVLKEYLDLLYEEIDIVKPQSIIVFGNQVSSIFLGEKISVKSVRKNKFSIQIKNENYNVYPVCYPVGNGMRNIDLAIEDIKYIMKQNSKA